MQTCGLCLCSAVRGLQGREKRAVELCNQSADSFKISLGGRGESGTACWESNSAAICNLLPNGNQSRPVGLNV